MPLNDTSLGHLRNYVEQRPPEAAFSILNSTAPYPRSQQQLKRGSPVILLPLFIPVLLAATPAFSSVCLEALLRPPAHCLPFHH
jgi:hypothetical protein